MVARRLTEGAGRAQPRPLTRGRARAAARTGEDRAPGGGRATATTITRLQALAGNGAVAGLLEATRGDEALRSAIGWEGVPLDAVTRAVMETFFGRDFGDVRVHATPAASAAVDVVGGDAFTVGSDIVVRPDHYRPGDAKGRHVVAHELAHVVQQRAGRVEGSGGDAGVRVSDPFDRAERSAEAAARLFSLVQRR